MEDSLSSCSQKLGAREESGWTAYFEDFSENSFDDDSSLVSDAASPSTWKKSTRVSPQIPKKLNFKKTRAKKISVDDSLEDTASSPVNSPKVSDYMNMNLSQGKEQHRIQVNFDDKNDSTDLKKRGLCLVPYSMLVNYIG